MLKRQGKLTKAGCQLLQGEPEWRHPLGRGAEENGQSLPVVMKFAFDRSQTVQGKVEGKEPESAAPLDGHPGRGPLFEGPAQKGAGLSIGIDRYGRSQKRQGRQKVIKLAIAASNRSEGLLEDRPRGETFRQAQAETAVLPCRIIFQMVK